MIIDGLVLRSIRVDSFVGFVMLVDGRVMRR